MPVVCKLKVTSIKLEPYGGWGDQPKVIARRVAFYPVQGEPFGKATPSGNVELLIVNPEAADYFEIEGEYLVSFEKTGGGLPVKIEAL